MVNLGRYWRLDGSFDTGRTSALGLKVVCAIEGGLKIRKREQKRRRKLRVRAIVYAKDNCWIELMSGEEQWVPILFIAYCWCKYMLAMSIVKGRQLEVTYAGFRWCVVRY